MDPQIQMGMTASAVVIHADGSTDADDNTTEENQS